MHGGDPMKRSVNNQVTTQAALAVLMSNTFFQPLFTWRIIIGPITPRLSIFASVVDNIFKNWIGVCFTQMTIFKVSNYFYEPFFLSEQPLRIKEKSTISLKKFGFLKVS